MSHRTTSPQDQDWLGLTRLASVLAGRQVAVAASGESRAEEEVVDRLHRMLEVLALVEEDTNLLRGHARDAADHEAMQLAVDLRRLANRLQAVARMSNSSQRARDGLESPPWPR